MKNVHRFRNPFAWSLLVCFALALCATNFYRTAQAQGGTWETKASAPTPIFGHAIGVAGGKLYSVGGASAATCCNNFPAPTFEYDPAFQSLRVHWPDGTAERWNDIRPDRVISLRQGEGTLLPPADHAAPGRSMP